MSEPLITLGNFKVKFNSSSTSTSYSVTWPYGSNLGCHNLQSCFSSLLFSRPAKKVFILCQIFLWFVTRKNLGPHPRRWLSIKRWFLALGGVTLLGVSLMNSWTKLPWKVPACLSLCLPLPMFFSQGNSLCLYLSVGPLNLSLSVSHCFPHWVLLSVSVYVISLYSPVSSSTCSKIFFSIYKSTFGWKIFWYKTCKEPLGSQKLRNTFDWQPASLSLSLSLSHSLSFSLLQTNTQTLSLCFSPRTEEYLLRNHLSD